MGNHKYSQSQICGNATPTIPPSKESGWLLLEGTAPVCGSAGASDQHAGRIGQYRILRLLGQGGMGMVYEAEQESLSRTVALKIIKPGIAGAESLRRFEHESWVLGRLQHPGIAQVFEASTADTGFGPQPYFVMEVIHGRPLLEYVAARELPARERLLLLRKICEGVHHAHQRGVIHRDLKPGNILVDDSGQPKILDFGVARATHGNAQVTLQTELGQVVGTLAYMSPEQTFGDPLEIDVRSDIYSLGAIAYELLAGRPPHQVGAMFYEAVRKIREEEPAPLGSIDRAYRGDVEIIVGKALEKEKARRYASVAELAADIGRYLDDEPVVARPASAGYQLRKFALRHRAVVAAAAAIFFVLGAGIAASTWQAARATKAEHAAILETDRAKSAQQQAIRERNSALQAKREATEAKAQAVLERNIAVSERQRADHESAISQAVSEFLQNDLLSQASAAVQARPGRNPDPDLKVRTALDRAAGRIVGKFAGQPVVEASIRQTIGSTYDDLGLYPQAQMEMERALELRRRWLGERHPDTLTTMSNLGLVYKRQGKTEAALALFKRTLQVRRSLYGAQHPDTISSLNELGALYLILGKYNDAIPLLIKATDGRRRLFGEENRDTLDSMNSLAGVYYKEGDDSRSEALLLRIMEINRRMFGDRHPDTLQTMNNLAMVYGHEGNYIEQERLLLEVLAVRRRLLGETHPDTLVSMSNLATAYSLSGKFAQAEPLLTAAVESRSRILGEDHPTTLLSMINLAGLYNDVGRYAEAEELYRKLLDRQRRVMGPEHPQTLSCMNGLALVYMREGRTAEAEEIFMNILETGRRVLGPEHPVTTGVLESLAEIRVRQNRYAVAEQLLNEALANRAKKSPDSWKRYYCQSLLGASLEGQARYSEAEPLLVSGYQGLIQREAVIPFADRGSIEASRKRIVQLYGNWGKPEKAAHWEQR